MAECGVPEAGGEATSLLELAQSIELIQSPRELTELSSLSSEEVVAGECWQSLRVRDVRQLMVVS